jgi:drug/metabolite transporter (DMT)-like permease
MLSREKTMDNAVRPASWKILLAFSIIYFVWGSTFLAIRVGVHEVPPFLLAAMRFLAAGVVLYAWMRVKGTAAPTSREWASACLMGTLIFLIDYGCLFWAERRVPSGVAAVVLATIPVFIAIFEIAFLRTQRLTLRLSLALLVGIGGVVVLVNRGVSLGESAVDHWGAIALVVAAVSWSGATILSRRLTLPASKPMSAAAQMTTGGVQLLILSALVGEFKEFHFQAVSLGAWFALFYLVVAGSIMGFTAYMWLLHYESPTKVGTYAYVNPVVAVAVGYFFGGESVGLRTLLGTLLILVSVIAITTTPAHKTGRREVVEMSTAEAE